METTSIVWNFEVPYETICIYTYIDIKCTYVHITITDNIIGLQATHCKKCGVIYDTMECLPHLIWCVTTFTVSYITPMVYSDSLVHS